MEYSSPGISYALPGELKVEMLGLKEKFVDFLKNFRGGDGGYKYLERIREALSRGGKSIVLEFQDLNLYDRELARLLIDKPKEALEALSIAATELGNRIAPEVMGEVERLEVRIRGLLKTLKIRELRSEHVGKLVQIDGILVRCTPVRQLLDLAVFACTTPGCGREYVKKQEGMILEPPEYPCEDCGKSNYKLVVEKSKYVDWQKVFVQEKPEETPSGQLPRSIEGVLRGDLVDVARPGDRVNVVGILKVVEDKVMRRGSRIVFQPLLEIVGIDVSQKALEEIEITREDEEKILKLARDPTIHARIVNSIAPTLYGIEDQKKAIALALFGGVPKISPDGTRVRGDIHVLLIGDPGTGKSMLLQYVSRVAPRGIYTTGRGATAAGLTAAVVRDKRTGEFYLEAGALVLADGGIACIDEIDKMRDEDRTAIHEALEQQTVSIAKAGIVARLNSRCSVIAAGNPTFGRYIDERPLTENINLPVTILSRFDLIFVLRDRPQPGLDAETAEHIMKVHRDISRIKPEIDPELLRKYISYARRFVKPRLSEEAIERLKQFYVDMRRKSAENPEIPIAITARQLEALVRLAEAHARMALRSNVTLEDAEEAIRLMRVFLEDVGIDRATGRIDIDTIMTGKPRSQQAKLSHLVGIISEMQPEGGPVRIRDVINKAVAEGLEREWVENALKTLKREGTIYEPRPGYISLVK